MDWQTLLGIATMISLACILIASSEIIFALPMKLVAGISGWEKLQANFPKVDTKVVHYLRFCSIGLNLMRYRFCVRVSIGDGFLTLQLHFPFRRFHKPISIPVSSLSKVGTSRRSIFLDEFAIDGSDVKLWLPHRVIQRLP